MNEKHEQQQVEEEEEEEEKEEKKNEYTEIFFCFRDVCKSDCMVKKVHKKICVN